MKDPFQGSIRNADDILRGFPEDLGHWMERASMQQDGTSDDNNDSYFNGMDEEV